MLIDACARIDVVPSFLSPELAAFMHRVGIAAGDGWHPVTLSGRNYMVPSEIRTRCGHCGSLQHLKCANPSLNVESNSITCKAICANSECKNSVSRGVSTILIVGLALNPNSRPKEFWILPKPKARKPSVDEGLISGNQASRIKRAYRSALKNFNDNDYTEAIAASGRVVEAIGKTVFPNSKATKNIGPLFYNLEDSVSSIPDFKELLTPLVNLGKALAVGRNTGGHFFLETEPDDNLASKVLDLTEFLLTYVYVVADQGSEVKRLIDACGPLDLNESENTDKPESSEATVT